MLGVLSLILFFQDSLQEVDSNLNLILSLKSKAINGPYSHGQQHYQHGFYGYPVKTYVKSNSSVLDSAQKDFTLKSYRCLKFFGQIYI